MSKRSRDRQLAKLAARRQAERAAALRRRNLIAADDFPHTTATDAVYDVGDYERSLDLALELVGPATVVVPGHGTPVDRDFAWEQRSSIGVVAETIRDLATRGVPVGEALAAGQWPYPAEQLGHAVRRGYEHLPRSQKRLPLI